jgi:hypothetical protein
VSARVHSPRGVRGVWRVMQCASTCRPEPAPARADGVACLTAPRRAKKWDKAFCRWAATCKRGWSCGCVGCAGLQVGATSYLWQKLRCTRPTPCLSAASAASDCRAA